MAASFSVPSLEMLARYVATSDRARSLFDVFTAIKNDIETLQTTAGALDWKNSVRAATTGALAANTRTGNVLTADANGALGAIDGVTLVVGDRLLVKNEATGANNGLYTVTSLGSGGTKWSLTRATDADTSAEVTSGMLVPVEAGTVNADKIFELDVEPAITLNTTALVFVDWRGLAITAPADVTKAAPAVGTSLTLARSDHKHDISTAVAGAITIGAAAAEGAATSLARSDHTHSLAAPAAPENVTKAAAAAGASTAAARADHKHDISTAVVGAIAIGDAAAEGSATSLARSDHVHSVAAPAAPADVTKAAAAAGASATFARADHKHDISTGAAGATAIGDSAAEGSATSLARSDHRHSVAAAAPVTVGVANAAGAAVTFSRSDHVHNNGNQTFDLTLDGVGGTATKNTGIVVTANTRAIVTLKTPGAGASGTRYAVAYSVGGAGVGSVTVTAKNSSAGNNTVTTDNSVLEVTLVEAAVVA